MVIFIYEQNVNTTVNTNNVGISRHNMTNLIINTSDIFMKYEKS